MKRPLLITAIAMLLAPPVEISAQARVALSGPVYVAYYWRAKADRIAEYHAYIKGYAEPIDEEARRAGAFEEVRTYLAPTPSDGQPPEWTHLRVFKLRDAAAADALSGALDTATKKRSETQQKAAAERAATLRGFVRQERWTELR